MPLAIAIDVEPGPQQAHVNPLGRKPIPVLILGADDFDVATIDVASVVFGPHDAQPLPRQRSRDLNGDSFVDLLLHFDTSETGIAFGDVEVCLSGQTLDGADFMGCDAIRTLTRASRSRFLSVRH